MKKTTSGLKKKADKKTVKKAVKKSKVKIAKHKKSNSIAEDLKRLIRYNIRYLACFVMVTIGILLMIAVSIRKLGEHNIPMMQMIADTQELNLQIQNDTYCILLSQDENYKKKYKQQIDSKDVQLQKQLKSMTENAAFAKDGVNSIQTILQEALRYRAQAILLALTDQQQKAIELLEEEYMPRMSDVDDCLSQIAQSYSSSVEQSLHMTWVSVLISALGGLILIVVVSLLGIKKSKKLIQEIHQPIVEIEAAMNEMAEGNLQYEIGYVDDNELGELAQQVRETGSNLRTYIEDINSVMAKLSEKNLTARTNAVYKGMFQPISNSINLIISVMKGLVIYIQNSSANILVSSQLLNQIAANLSRQSSNQLKIVEELCDDMNDVSRGADANIQNAKLLTDIVRRSSKKVQEGNDNVVQLQSVMTRIENSAEKVVGILSIIQGISENIELLSLNASIEAARAGSSGNGFAVVADEMRKLVVQTKDATEISQKLIKACEDAVLEGQDIVGNVGRSFDQILQVTAEVNDVSEKVLEQSISENRIFQKLTEKLEGLATTASENIEISVQISRQGVDMNEQIGMMAEEMKGYVMVSEAKVC